MFKNNCGSDVEICRVLSLLDIAMYCVKRIKCNVVLYPLEFCCRLSLKQELEPIYYYLAYTTEKDLSILIFSGAEIHPEWKRVIKYN